MSAGWVPRLREAAGVTNPRTRKDVQHERLVDVGDSSRLHVIGIAPRARPRRGAGVAIEVDLVDPDAPAGEQGLGDAESGHRHPER